MLLALEPESVIHLEGLSSPLALQNIPQYRQLELTEALEKASCHLFVLPTVISQESITTATKHPWRAQVKQGATTAYL